jgi:hypothetical protein
MAIPFLNNINLSNNELQNAKLHITGSLPSPATGHIYYDGTTDNKVKVRDNSQIQTVAWESWVTTNYPGTVTSVSSATTNQLTIANGTTAPSLTIVTGAVVDGGTALATGDQIYDFVIGLGYSTTTGTVTSVAIAGTDGIDVDSGSPITSAGTITLGLSNVPNTSLANDSITIGDSTIALGGTDTTLTGLTDIDLTAGNHTIFDNVGANTLTIGAGTTTVAIPGDLVVTGTTTTNNVEVVSTSNGVIFEGNVADANELTLLAGTLTADRTITLPDLSGTVVLETFVQIQTDSGTLVANSDRDTMSIIGGNAIETSGNAATDVILISHADTSSQASVDNSGVTVIQDVTLDTYGHVTGLASVDLTSGINSLIDTKISATGYAVTITDTATVTHNLGTDVIIQLFDITTGETVYADVDRISTSQATITFASTPTNSIRVLVQQIN